MNDVRRRGQSKCNKKTKQMNDTLDSSHFARQSARLMLL
jgi:hypothetical protein